MFNQKRVFELSRTILAILISLVLALFAILVVSEEPWKALGTFLCDRNDYSSGFHGSCR
jgi:ABC-type uncharacterized transport system permease subunit